MRDRAASPAPGPWIEIPGPEKLEKPVTIKLTWPQINMLTAHKVLTVHDHEDWQHLHADEHVTFSHRVRIEPHCQIYHKHYRAMIGGAHSLHGLATIGFQSYSWSGLPEAISIGRYCSMADDIRFLDSQHPMDLVSTAHWTHRNLPIVTRALQERQIEPLHREPFDIMMGKAYPVIENDVWIGHAAILAAGIRLGTGSVIAAGSVVTKSVQPYEIVGGNPAKHIKFRFAEEVRSRLLASRWWQYHFADIHDLPVENMPLFLDQLDKKKAAGMRPYQPAPLILPDAWL